MRTRLTLIALIAIALLLPVQVAADGWLKAVHGIDGRDLGANEKFPVDIAVSGVGCAITDFRFGEITDYIALPAGNYTIDISPSDGACGNSPVLSPEVKIRDGRYLTAAAHLDESGGPAASAFQDDLPAARQNNGRVSVGHTAAVPTVDITYGKNKQRDKNLTFSGVSNGQGRSATFSAKNYKATIYPYLGSDVVAGPVSAPITAGANLFVYAVGSLAKGTFTLLVDAEPLAHN
jgi:hypothetical protein